jgi:hypothetical protein
VQAPAIRWARVGDVALAAWFITISVMRLAHLATADPFSDSTLYLRGTAAWLRGEDPWSVHMTTLYYAAAPPSLLPMVPFAVLPESVGLAVLFVLSLAASFWTLRRLGLPWWWITWPPLVDNLWNGNPQLFLVPLLLGSAAWFAPIVKAYAVVPMIIQLRVRTIFITAVVVLLTLPFLPWGTFLARLSNTTTLLPGPRAVRGDRLARHGPGACVVVGDSRALAVDAVVLLADGHAGVDAPDGGDPGGTRPGRPGGRGHRRSGGTLVASPPARGGAG